MQLSPVFIGRIILILICLFFSYQLLSIAHPWIFFDNLNLLIHEEGHFLFRPFGEFLYILGGSLFQILFPCFFLVYFFRRHDYFSVSFILFWVADNIINVSVYMRDAQVMQLPLLGGDGVIHDWHWLFTAMGVLPQTQIIGGSFFVLGVLCLLASIFGMVYFTLAEARALK